ncbi:MAG: phosphoglucosamine mutase, partial [Pseudoflavonifractor sp.]
KREGRPTVTIGKDTRISSDLLEGALIAGLCSAGADVLHLGVIPTPAVAYLTAHSHADAGVVISASHNPYEHNGIKLFNGNGFKLSDAMEAEIEEIILSEEPVQLKTHGDIGRVTYADQRESQEYIDHLFSTVEGNLAGLRILVDCANGAASATAARLFDRFPKLHTDVINADPDGVNINAGCGSTHIGSLCTMVKAGGYDLGLAFDGDADRCLACDELGNEIDGDQVMAACGKDLKSRGALPGNTIVATVMSNLGLHVFARENGISLLCTDVGDRNVLEKMEACGYILGGEQSGHTIFRRFATTGDGQLTGLQLLQLMHSTGKKASELTAVCQRYPQILVNIPVADEAKKLEIMASHALSSAVAEQEALLNGDGRILVRPSGTEALVRVMVEAKEGKIASSCANS